MSLLESASPHYSPKPYWTATKIVAVVLVAIVTVSSLGADYTIMRSYLNVLPTFGAATERLTTPRAACVHLDKP